MYRYAQKIAKVFVFGFALVGLFLTLGYIAMRTGLTKTSGTIDEQSKYFLSAGNVEYTRFPLAHTPEWITFRQAVVKDKEVIEKVSKETGVPARILITPLIPEQMRLFHSQRPIFKEIFAPLKILGAQSQFSWGIMGIKDETAREVERRLKDPTSPSYLGAKFKHLLDFKTDTPDQERFSRITDPHDHYYSYLYTALYLKEIMKEWEKAGFDIADRPEILGTLFNIGFAHSTPKADPKSGGAEIDLGGTVYSFGALAGEFYYSDELVEFFPPIIQ